MLTARSFPTLSHYPSLSSIPSDCTPCLCWSDNGICSYRGIFWALFLLNFPQHVVRAFQNFWSHRILIRSFCSKLSYDNLSLLYYCILQPQPIGPLVAGCLTPLQRSSRCILLSLPTGHVQVDIAETKSWVQINKEKIELSKWTRNKSIYSGANYALNTLFRIFVSERIEPLHRNFKPPTRHSQMSRITLKGNRRVLPGKWKQDQNSLNNNPVQSICMSPKRELHRFPFQ